MLKVSEGFDIERVTVIVTHRCNLRCKLCVQRIAEYDTPYHPTKEFLFETIDRLFALDVRVRYLGLGGGEPLLRSDLDEILDYLLPHMRNVGTFDLITNGSVLPSGGLLDSAARWGERMRFIIDDYGPRLSPRVAEVSRLFAERGIPHRVNDYHRDLHCSGWVDFGDFSKRGDAAFAREMFAKCNFPSKLSFCFEVVDGKADPCAPGRQCRERGLPVTDTEWVDLFDDTVSPADKRARLLGWYSADKLNACMYCGGMCDDSVRYRPAEQLLREEAAGGI